ncbi:MAG: hypothetical protein LBH34_04405 [Prevotellaceae bacterium]|jgi:hypothetical protein|nr:hypothetical protein [Prevotellaceae bacterium]
MKNILMVFALIAAFAIVSCSKEKSDFDKGKEDGKALCDCVKKALDLSSEEAAELATFQCMSKLDITKISMEEEDESKWSEYQKGVASVDCSVGR